MRVVLGVGALFLGALEYILSRPASSTHFGEMVHKYTGGFNSNIQIFGDLGKYFPDFAHPFAFALLTVSLFPSAGRVIRGSICLLWLVIDLLFEIGQNFGQVISEMIEIFIPPSRISGLLSDYFVNGTYDFIDILFICLGIVLAFYVTEFTTNGGKENESKKKTQKTIGRLEDIYQEPVIKTGCYVPCPDTRDHDRAQLHRCHRRWRRGHE